MVVMAGGRLRGRGFDSPIGTFFFSTPFFFSVSFFPLSFSFMLAPPFHFSSKFLVVVVSNCCLVYAGLYAAKSLCMVKLQAFAVKVKVQGKG